MPTAPAVPGLRGAGAWSGAVLAGWLLLLGSAFLPSVALQRGALTGVCLLAALSCWARSLAGTDRAVWRWFAVALTGYAVGYVLLFYGGPLRTGPLAINISDLLSLALFPAGFVALLLLVRRGVQALDPRALLDGIVVALATCSVALALAGIAHRGLFEGGTLPALYRTAYPVGTLLLLVVTVSGLFVVRRLDRVYVLLLVGFTVMTGAEIAYAWQSAAGSFRFGTPLDAAFVTGPVLVSLAAWSAASRPAVSRPGSSTTIMGLTAVATLSTLAVLVDRDPRIPSFAIVTGAAGIVAAVLRTVLFLRQELLLEVRTRQALTDPLTELPNRRLLLTEIDTRLALGHEPSLLMLNLDRFQGINDSLGLTAGDELLQQVASRLSTGAPPDSVVARLGGDEFAVLLPPGHGEVVRTARQLRAAIERSVTLGGKQVLIAGSVGLAVADPVPPADDGLVRAGTSELLRRADVALRHAKRTAAGLEQWRPELDEGTRDLLALIAELRAALQSGGQLVVHLQPKCDPTTRDVRAYEALVRWQHPERGLLAPGAFLGAAEEGGLLVGLTTAVLEAALDAGRRLADAGHCRPVAVNVSAPDLLDPHFASRVAQALDRHGLLPAALRLEVTETVVMHDPARIVRTLRLLRGIGVGVSLDDYGTGLSSLAYLRELPIDELKIDRVFVAGLASDRASRLIVTSTVELAHALGMTVVAEGVEDEATLEALRHTGCDLVQGYLTGRPAPLAPQLWPVEPELSAAVPA